jgi:hypothetical protein
LSWTLQWMIAFCFTQLVEMGVYVNAHAPRPDGTVRSSSERLAIAFAASGITHPLVWFVIPDLAWNVYGIENWWVIMAVAEAFALFTEALFLAACGVRWAILWSLLANGTSYLVGLFCYEAFPDW